MSPQLRSMLEDAADDDGRPVRLDLGQIRAGGRRAVWRRRVLVGGGALGVAAVVSSVAIIAPTMGRQTDDLLSGSENDVATSAQSLEAAGLSPLLEPLFDAISAAGYDAVSYTHLTLPTNREV